MQKYLDYISVDCKKSLEELPKNERIFMEDEGIDSLEKKQKGIYNLLDKNYIDKNKITENNILKKIMVNGKVNFIPLKMKYVEGYFVQKFSVQGFLESIEDSKQNKKVLYIVTIDKLDNTFSIEPLDSQKYDNIEKIKLEKTEERIEKNANNEYSYSMMTEHDIIQKYFLDYKRKSLNNVEEAYNLLDKEYREKRFGDIDSYKKYIENNRNEINSIVANKYLVNNFTDYKQYVCKDQYENLYIFDISASMQYTVKLDTYTIETDKFKETYASANTQKKTMMNVDKWIMMLNNRDYKAAYNVLDETFRNNKFRSEENFEQYMRQKYPLHYSVEYTDYKYETNLAIQTIQLSDITNENKEIKELKIIMQLEENTDFSMSFEI